MKAARVSKEMLVGRREDYISRLPDELLHRILSTLSLSEAAATSVLSRRWRYVFHSTPDLRLSQFNLRGESGGAPSNDDGFAYMSRSDDALFDILRLRTAPVKSLAVSSDGPRFGDILGLLPRKNVEELVIMKGYDGEHQEIPPEVFACRTIRKLALSRSTLTIPPSFVGLRDLQVLELRNVDDRHGCLQRMLSQCPAMERLVLDFLYTPKDVVINANNLVELNITTRWPLNVKIENAPRLVSVALELNYRFSKDDDVNSIRPSRLAEFLSGLGQIENLSVDFTARYASGVPLREGLGFNILSCRCKMFQLKKLTLGLNYADKNLASILLFLLDNTPGLQELTILVSYELSWQGITYEEFWDTKLPSNCLHSSLRSAVFYLTPHVLRDYIHFPKFVLMKASNLREMIIRYKSHLEETSHIKQVKQELLCFPKASPHVVLELTPICLDDMPKLNNFSA